MSTKTVVNVMPVYINKTIKCKNNRIVQQPDTHTQVESRNNLGIVGIPQNNILENQKKLVYIKRYRLAFLRFKEGINT